MDEFANAETLPGSRDDAPAGAQLAPGNVLLDRYRIVRWLGAGGMGAVYAAHDAKLDQPVALKLIGGARSAVERDQLRAEVRTLQGLTHRNIARTFTYDEADGEPFIVMELLDGETLAARIARGRLDEPEVRTILGALAVALDEAHRAGVVHRDVKPPNVMLCSGGRVVLMDFGLARADDAPAPDGPSRSVLHTTSLKGTPAYLAPEMALGRRVDARADLYSLGVLAYEALTGKLPFQADSAKGMIDQHITGVPEDLRARRADVSPALGALIDRLLAKQPDDRPASAAAVITALAPRRRRRWPLVVAAGCVLAAVITMIAWPRDRPASVAAVVAPDAALVSFAEVAPIFDRAQAAFEAHDYDTAYRLFTQAYTLRPAPEFLYNVATAAKLSGRPDEAAFYFQRYLDQSDHVRPEERTLLEAEIRELEAKLDAGPP